MLDKKVSVDKKRNAHIEIKEKDRDLICHIVERLWSSQIEDVGTRLVLCINEQEIQSRVRRIIKADLSVASTKTAYEYGVLHQL